MKLLGANASPYALKVIIVLEEKGLPYEYVVVRPTAPEVFAANPLSKIPTFIRDDGRALYDSAVIIEYLDGIASTPKLIPEQFEDRIEVKRWDALADGIIDAAVAIMHENRLPETQRKGTDWYARQRQKIDAALATMERDLGTHKFCTGGSFTLADVTGGTALSYLGRVLPELDWRGTHSVLAGLAERLLARPSFRKALAS